MEKNRYKVAKIRKSLNFSFKSGDAKRPGEVLSENDTDTILYLAELSNRC